MRMRSHLVYLLDLQPVRNFFHMSSRNQDLIKLEKPEAQIPIAFQLNQRKMGIKPIHSFMVGRLRDLLIEEREYLSALTEAQSINKIQNQSTQS